MTTKNISPKALINFFQNESFTESVYIKMNTVTTQALTGGKKNPMKGLVKKLSIGHNVAIFDNRNKNSYEDMVKFNLIKEGKDPESFELSPRPWGTRIPNSPLVEHKGEYYLEVIFIKAGNTMYTYNGNPITKEEIEGFPLPKPNTGQGGLQDQVQIRTFKINSITQLTMNKITYNLI